mmetsp:Transcript_5965/g.14766  ORF Transcript_5965/g.14766 Transcript_5965/m.14766 type:complete len:291 (-) Transcript_5965:117-989(-)
MQRKMMISSMRNISKTGTGICNTAVGRSSINRYRDQSALLARIISTTATPTTTTARPLASSSSSSYYSLIQNQIPRRSFGMLSPTTPMLEKVTMKVPTMGDSITEGTIVEWTVEVGQMVQEEDVVALIETDKVTVDIKANTAGVIVKQYGAVDENIEVGADLCEIDTEAVATVDSASSSSSSDDAPAPEPPAKAPAPAAAAAAANAPAPPAPASSSSSGGERTPSIRFLGKDGWEKRLNGQDPFEPSVIYVPFNYGRLKFSEDESEALLMGGANLAPEVERYSSGASFSA